MKTRFRLIRRGIRGGAFYCVDGKTGRRVSLGSASEDEARQIVAAKNQAERQPVLNLQIAKAYLVGADSAFATRTWKQAIEILTDTKKGANRARWERVVKDKAMLALFPKVLIETSGEFLLHVLKEGTVSTNVFLRRLHNFCVDMNWIPVPLVPKRSWPSVRYKEKRAVTFAEHIRIIEREKNPERKAFYQMAWHLGASQSDLANLEAEDVNWDERIICFDRMKTRWRGQQPPQIRFGTQVEEILEELSRTGKLFPHLAEARESDRATEFAQRCEGLGIVGITLHSYRYSWAERAKTCGYPAGLHIYVAIAPTYPECDEEDLRATLTAVGELDPVTIFHEPINIRAENVERINSQAKSLGISLKTDVFETRERWQEYAVNSLRSVERIANELSLSNKLHLWPDKSLGNTTIAGRVSDSKGYLQWLSTCWNRISEWA